MQEKQNAPRELPERWSAKRKAEVGEGELVRTRAKLGETIMRLELAEMLLEKKGVRGRREEAQEIRSKLSRFTGKRYRSP